MDRPRISSSVGFCPIDLRTCSNSLFEMVPLPSCKMIKKLKFIYSEKATKCCYNAYCQFSQQVCTNFILIFVNINPFLYINDQFALRNLHQLIDIRQIIGGDFAKFCGLLRIYELHKKWLARDERIMYKQGEMVKTKWLWGVEGSKTLLSYGA